MEGDSDAVEGETADLLDRLRLEGKGRPDAGVQSEVLRGEVGADLERDMEADTDMPGADAS